MDYDSETVHGLLDDMLDNVDQDGMLEVSPQTLLIIFLPSHVKKCPLTELVLLG